MNTFQLSLEILHGAFDELCNSQKDWIWNLKKKKRKKVACSTLFYVKDLSMVSPMLWVYPLVELLFKETWTPTKYDKIMLLSVHNGIMNQNTMKYKLSCDVVEATIFFLFIFLIFNRDFQLITFTHDNKKLYQ